MARKGRDKPWLRSDISKLIENYPNSTIFELEDMLERPADSINAKIRRLKNEGRLSEPKTESAIKRAYEQRRRVGHQTPV